MRVAVAVLAVLCTAQTAWAHESDVIASGSPSGWDIAALCLLALSGAMYAGGAAKLRARGARVRRIERAAFWAGWIAMVAAVAPPLDAAAAAMFSAHMAQHEVLMLVGAPLMIVGRPIVPWLWALPAKLRPIAAGGLQQRAVSRAWDALTAPALTWAIHGAVIWLWHAPALYEAALASEAVHALQHAMFVGTAVLFWWGLVYGRYGRAAYGASALFVFITMVHTGVLGALFALSTSPYYDLYMQRAASAGVDPVTDQQLAGLYMWIPSGIVLTVFGLALVTAWLSESDRRAGRRHSSSLPREIEHKNAPGVLPLLVGLVLISSAACGSVPHAEEVRMLTGGDPYRGRDRIRKYGCDTCHTIPGVPEADASVGPPLTQVARRMYLAGHIANTPENMRHWIQHPHAHDAQTAMPEMGVTDQDGRDIVAYLYTLR
jgi:putative membrane protein